MADEVKPKSNAKEIEEMAKAYGEAAVRDGKAALEVKILRMKRKLKAAWSKLKEGLG